jgi:hypothetical protein
MGWKGQLEGGGHEQHLEHLIAYEGGCYQQRVTIDVNVGVANKGDTMDANIKELVDDETIGASSQM